ncbi:tripartite tricarboxylate transporter substrate binding protein [soil metagenome]
MFKKLIASAAVATLALAATSVASAQTYPEKTVRLIVPYASGGSTDTTARLMAKELSLKLGQAFIVENRPGAGGAIGQDAVAKATPDGYTLLFSSAGPLTVTPHTYPTLPYEPIKSFAPVKLVASAPLVLVANPSLPVQSVKDVIALAKSKPGKLTYASFGNGSAAHLAGELFKSIEGIDMVHIPYNGSAPALTDLLGGQVDMMFDVVVTSLPHIEAGKLRPLAITSPQRLSVLPKVPTMAEAGVKNFDASTWFGLLAPAGTPPAVIAKLSAALDAALKEPEVQKTLAAQGALVEGGTPEAFGKFFQSEYDKWGKVVASAGVKAE